MKALPFAVMLLMILNPTAGLTQWILAVEHPAIYLYVLQLLVDAKPMFSLFQDARPAFPYSSGIPLRPSLR